jgi:hypothetical protein
VKSNSFETSIMDFGRSGCKLGEHGNGIANVRVSGNVLCVE